MDLSEINFGGLVNEEAIINAVNGFGSAKIDNNTVNANSNANVLIALSATDFDGTVSKLRPVTLITGLEAGNHFIVPPAFFNDNFLVTYGLGELVIEKAKLKIEAVANPAPFVYGTPFANLQLE